MTKFSFNQAVPFEATHVGEVIKDELAARNMKQSELVRTHWHTEIHSE